MGEVEDMSKKSCVLYDSWGELIANLPDEMAGQLIKQIITYAFDMEQPTTENPAIWAMFSMIKTKLDEDAEKYQAKVDRLKNNSERNRHDIDTISERNQNDIGGVSESVSDSVYIYESDKDIKKEKEQKKRFIKPTIEEVKVYCQERDNGVNPEAFIDFYESKGWKVGNQPMKDWKAAVRTWEKRSDRPVSNKSSPVSDKYAKIHNFGGERKTDYDALGSELINR